MHLGLAILAAGVVVSSMFKIRQEFVLRIGESANVGPYIVTPISQTFRNHPVPGEPYRKDEVVFEVARRPGSGLPEAHGDSGSAPGSEVALTPEVVRQAKLVAKLEPERRFYPKKNQWISEVTIHRRAFEDIYIYFSGRNAEGAVGFVVFINPFMMLIYAGWLTMGARLGSGLSFHSWATRLRAMNLTLIPWGSRACSKLAAAETETTEGSRPRTCPYYSVFATQVGMSGVSGRPTFIRSMPEPASSCDPCNQ